MPSATGYAFTMAPEVGVALAAAVAAADPVVLLRAALDEALLDETVEVDRRDVDDVAREVVLGALVVLLVVDTLGTGPAGGGLKKYLRTAAHRV